MNKEKNCFKKYGSLILVGTILIIIYKIFDQFSDVIAFLKNLINIMMPVNIGIIISIFLYLPVNFLEKKFMKSKNKYICTKANIIAITIVYIISILLILLAASTIIPTLYNSCVELVKNFGNYAQSLIKNLDDYNIYGIDIEMIKNFIKSFDISKIISLDKISNYTKSIVGFGSSILDFFVSIIISIYILASRHQLYKSLMRILNANLSDNMFKKAKKYIDNTIRIFAGFISAQVLDAFIIGILETIVLLVLGVKYAILLGFFIGLSNIIPYFGAIIGVAISFIITCLSGGIMQAIWMLIAVTIVQQIDANIINPKIIGDELKIAPLLVIISVLVGGAYFGVVGMFLAVPIAALLKLVLIDYIDLRLKEKESKKNLNKNIVTEIKIGKTD